MPAVGSESKVLLVEQQEMHKERLERRSRRSTTYRRHQRRHHHSNDDDDEDGNVSASGGDMKHEVVVLRKMVKTLASEQHDLQKQMVLLSQMRLTTESNMHKIQQELAVLLNRVHRDDPSSDATASSSPSSGSSSTCAQLETQQRDLTRTVETLALKVSGVDQVQSSTLQLFEALQKLQDRYDDSIGQLEREVSKLEFNDDQLTSDVHTLRQDQADVNGQLRAAKSQLNVVQETLQSEMVRAALIHSQLVNQTVSTALADSTDSLQNWRLANLEQQYTNVVDNLPHGKFTFH